MQTIFAPGYIAMLPAMPAIAPIQTNYARVEPADVPGLIIFAHGQPDFAPGDFA